MFRASIQNRIQKHDYSSEHTLKGCLDHQQNDSSCPRKPGKIQVPEELHAGKTCFVVDSVLSYSECQKTIERAEAAGFRPALVNVGDGEMLLKDSRNSDRCIIDDKDFARAIFERIQHALPKTLEASSGSVWNLSNLNGRMRILRYGSGHFFAEHRDGSYSANMNERSFLTVMIYLNDGGNDFVGGCTNLIAPPKRDRMHRMLSEVVPRNGRVLVFDHDLLHEGGRLFSGTKYAIRTDVMYTRDDPIATMDVEN
jgi:hypothetical protein